MSKPLVASVDARKMLSEAKFFESYSRFIDAKQRFETWDESVERVMQMHKEKYLINNPLNLDVKDYLELQESIDFAEGYYKQKKVLGAQRALQFGGEQLLKHNIRLYNCVSSYCDRPQFFGEFMYMLLCGAGAGFSVQWHHIAKLPRLTKRTGETVTFEVQDSIEGWAEAFDVLLSSFFVGGGKHPEYEGKKIHFDLTNIRLKGSLIAGHFKAPGPEPLRKALDLTEALIKKNIAKYTMDENGHIRMNPIDYYDICMYMADAVISGGVRRSATICLFSKDDEEMVKAKTGDWYISNPQRGRSNNSAVLVRKDISFQEFEKIMVSVQHSGEPGFIFTDDRDFTYNPCFTGETIVAVADGRNGVPIKDLADEYTKNGIKFPVYSARDRGITGRAKSVWKTEIKMATAFKTGTREIIEVKLSNGTSFKCTPNHELATPDGRWIKAKDSKGERLEEFFTYSKNPENKHHHRNIKSYSDGHSKQHRMLWEFHNGKKPIGMEIDHIEGNGYDGIDNLQLITKEEHNLKSALEISGENNGVHKVKNDPRYLNNLSARSFKENNSNYSGLSDEYLIEVGKIVLKKYGKITHPLLIKEEPKFPKFISKNRFNGSLQSFKNIVLGVEEYEKKIPPEKIELEKIIDEKYSKLVSVDDIIYTGETEDVYDLTVDDNHNFYILTDGDEGFKNSSGVLVHNCVEIGKYPQTEDGRTGWQGCNLCEMNGSMVTSREEFINMARAASILGTLQAGYTDFKFLESSAKEIFEKESLIGISITGWMNSPSILFDKQNMIDAAEEVKAVNKRIASLIKINPAARTTCVKPSGNASVLLATANGIHGEHSKKYIRHVQLNKESEVAQILSKINPDMMEESAWSANGTDYCVAFPIVPPEGSIYKKDLLGVKQLDYVKLAQEYWVEYGTNEDLCVKKGLRHNVSNTITVDDWDEVTEYVYKNRYSFCGISFLAASGDKAYMQAPNAEVLDMQEIVDKYGEASLLCSALIEAGLNAFNTNLWNACSTAMGYGEDISTAKHENAMKRDWVRRFDKFTTNFITGEYSEADKEAHLFGTESMANLYSELDKLKLGKESVIALNCLDAEDLVLFSDTVDAKIVKIIEEIQNFKDILATNKYTKALADSRQICSDCLKDVYYFHKWWKIEKAIKHIDWAEVLKTKVLTDIDTMAAVACAGGKCEI